MRPEKPNLILNLAGSTTLKQKHRFHSRHPCGNATIDRHYMPAPPHCSRIHFTTIICTFPVGADSCGKPFASVTKAVIVIVKPMDGNNFFEDFAPF